ncbi:hypothetical protein ACN47E_004362 [Coniothyrium glycines]
MTKLSLEHLDHHLYNLRESLKFLNETLEATDHNDPDWLATDLISLRNKSGRLQDDMKRFRDQIETGGLAETKAKSSNKRLSIENAKPSTHPPKPQTPGSHKAVISPLADQSPTPRATAAEVEGAYEVQHIDVTEEVNRRLRESRLRRLMETPSTAQKRKYNAYEEPRSGSTADPDDGDDSRGGWSGSEYEKTPTKRLKSSGNFERVGKRKDDTPAEPGTSGRFADRIDIKRRRL